MKLSNKVIFIEKNNFFNKNKMSSFKHNLLRLFVNFSMTLLLKFVSLDLGVFDVHLLSPGH